MEIAADPASAVLPSHRLAADPASATAPGRTCAERELDLPMEIAADPASRELDLPMEIAADPASIVVVEDAPD